jgi:glycosyltransferase involved in cell wall biosynthesis
MKGESIFLYANQPGVRRNNRYYARFTSFADFLASLAGCDRAYLLMLPCLRGIELKDDQCSALDLPENVVELSGYENGSHLQAARSSFINALRARRLIRSAVSKGANTIVGGPGPNSFLFWLSLISPRQVRFAFFVRGDTVETIRNIYRGKIFYYPAVLAVKLFRWQLCRLLRDGRARVFVFGEKLRRYYGKYRSADVHTIAPLVSESYLRTDPRPPISPQGLLKVLYVGRLSQEKNVLALLEACKISRDQGRPFSLTIVGTGLLEEPIDDFIQQFKLSDSVRFLGYVPNGKPLIEQYDAHDVLCLPSFTEGMPGVVAEAFARGMPVLATKVGGLPDFFPDAIKFVGGFRPEDIEEAIAWCDKNRGETSLYGQRGQAKIGDFLISRNAQRVDRIIRAESSWIAGQTG